MKKLLLMVAAAILGFTACDDGGGEIIFGSITIKDKAQLDQEVGAAGDIVNVDFESEMQWSASVTEGAEWMSLVSPSSGEAGEFSLEIEVRANDTASAREGSVSIVCGDDRVAIKIRQFSEDGGSDDDVNSPGEAAPISKMVRRIDYYGVRVGFNYDSEGRIVRMDIIDNEYDEHIDYDLTYGDGTITLSFETEWEGSTPSYPGTEGTVIGGRNVVEYVATLNSDGMVASYEGSSILYIDSDGSGDIYDSSFGKGEMEYANGRLVKITVTDDNGNEQRVYDFQWRGDDISKVSYTLRGEGLLPVDLYSEITAGELLNDPEMSVDINYLFADDEVLGSVFDECPFVIMGLCGERSAHLISSIRTYDDGAFMYESPYTYDVDGLGRVIGGSVSGDEFYIEYLN